ncbi:MAG: hypothetical protein ABR545_07110 [Cyclonatronaceae bacterium]
MKIISNHKWWWIYLITATIIVSIITSQRFTVTGLLYSIAGHLVFSIGVATIPWLFYRLTGNPLTTVQMMWTITVAWLILAVANLSEIP